MSTLPFSDSDMAFALEIYREFVEFLVIKGSKCNKGMLLALPMIRAKAHEGMLAAAMPKEAFDLSTKIGVAGAAEYFSRMGDS